MKKLLFLFVAFIAFQATAQTADKAAVITLLKSDGTATYYENLFDVKAKNITNKEAQVTKVLTEIAEVYDDYLTTADVAALQSFYNSETGKKLGEHKRNEFTEADSKAYMKFTTSPAMEKLTAHRAEISKQKIAIQKKWLATIE